MVVGGTAVRNDTICKRGAAIDDGISAFHYEVSYGTVLHVIERPLFEYEWTYIDFHLKISRFYFTNVCEVLLQSSTYVIACQSIKTDTCHSWFFFKTS